MKLVDNRYQFAGGMDALDIVNKYDCPVYVYETSKIKEQIQRMRKAFSVKRLGINYACKALTNINILKFMKSQDTGLDTVSIQEVMLGLKAGFSADKIMFTPNCVSIEEIVKAVELGVRINIDNLSILEQFGDQFPDYPICLRINPHIMAGGNSKISTGHIDSKFGISVHQLPLIIRTVNAMDLKIEGLHMHTGSDILDADVFLQGAEILFQVAESFEDLDFLDFGSGFKISYDHHGIETDIEDLGEKISIRFNEFCKTYGKELELIFEPGKYLVSESGHFLVRVNVVKQTTSTVFAGVDSGLNHLIRPMLYDAYHSIANISNPNSKKRIYTVVGYICETDTFGINRKLDEVREGDVLAFYNAGAYCYSMSSNYNSRYRPPEVMIHDGKDYLIRKREDMEDLTRNQVEHDVFS